MRVMGFAKKLCSTNALYFLCGVLFALIVVLCVRPTHVGLDENALSQEVAQLSSNCPACEELCKRQAKLYRLKECEEVLGEAIDCQQVCPSSYRKQESPHAKGKMRSVTNENIPPELRDDEWDPDTDDVPIQRLPKALIIGFSRTGTAALKRFINLHPRVRVLDWDISYFCDVHYFMYTMTWYRKMMPETTSDQITLEKSPCYIQERKALQRIKAFNSTVKLIISVRHPITRIVSLYGQMKEKYRQFGTPMKTIEEFLLKPGGALNTEFIQKAGVYGPKVAEVFRTFTKKQVHFVDGEVLVTDPLSEMKRMETFLGINHWLNDGDFYFNKTKGYYCWKIRRTGEKDCLSPHKGRKHETLSDELVVSLQRYLKPFNEEFFNIVGRRFEWDEY